MQILCPQGAEVLCQMLFQLQERHRYHNAKRRKVASAGGSSTSVTSVAAAAASPASPSVGRDIHLHCENCINVTTCNDSTCPIVPCDCGHKLHECKLDEHALICRDADFKVREALVGRTNDSRWMQKSTGHCRSRVVAPASAIGNFDARVSSSSSSSRPLSRSLANSMASPSHLDASSASQCASNQEFLPTSTPPTSPLDSTSPSHSNTNSTPCAGKRFLLDDAEMNVLETLAKENPDLLTHGVNLDIEETITGSPEDDTPPGVHDSDLMSPSSERVSGLGSARNSIPSVEIFPADSAEGRRRTDSLVELGENIVAEAVQLAKTSVEGMLLRMREEKLAQQAKLAANARSGQNVVASVAPLASSGNGGASSATAAAAAATANNSSTMSSLNKAEEQKQTLEMLDSMMKAPKPAARASLTVDEVDSLSEEPENNEPDSEQMLDDASLSLHAHEEPETVSEESSSCLEPVRVPSSKSPTLEDIPDLPDDQEKRGAKLKSKERQVIEEVDENDDEEHGDDDDDDDSQTSDTESHSPSPVDNYRRSTTVVRKVKKVETTSAVIKESSMKTSGTQEQPQPIATSSSNRESLTRQTSIHAAREASPVEDVKLSVDKKKLQSQFSVGSAEVDGKCRRCQTTVYPAERIRAEKSQYHKKCFTCKECKKSLSAESYHSHESELYCANHFKQLFQPKANFDPDLVTPNDRQEVSPGCPTLHEDGNRREPIIRENEPAQLPPDVVRCGTGSTMEDLEGLNLNLASIKSHFEQRENSNHEAVKGQPAIDRGALSRSELLRKRLERYQSVVAGEAKADSSDEEDADGERSHVDYCSIKKIEASREIGELKAQWESGRVNNDLDQDEDAAMVVKEEQAERLEAARSEKEDDLSVCQDPVIAQRAKLMFRKIDQEIASRPAQGHAPGLASCTTKMSSENRWSRTTSLHEVSKDVDVVHASEPGHREPIEIETAALSERYKFFENYNEEAASVKKKKFQMTPPRELDNRERDNASPPAACERDPNVVVGSITTDDIPNVDTATKMRQKFETLCQSGANSTSTGTQQAPKPRPLKRSTSSVQQEGLASQVTPSYHTSDPESLPADNITRNMRAMFEANAVAQNGAASVREQPSGGCERNITPKVNRFVNATDVSY